MTLLARLVLIWSAFFGLSCQSDQEIEAPKLASLVDGGWTRSCQPHQNYYQRINHRFSFGERFERQEIWYFDKDCKQQAYQTVYRGSYELTTTWEPYRYILDLWVEESEMKSLSLPWQEQANALAFCGKSDWHLPLSGSQAGNPAHTPCPLLFQDRSYQKNLIEVTEEELIFAESFRPGNFEEAAIDLNRKELQFVRVSG